MRDLDIYTLPEPEVPLTEEMIAVTMAKCSRSPRSFRENAMELTEEKSSDFNERVVLGYGHASVAEGAIPTICFENVSIIASKVLEAAPRPSVQEKSTRYQEFNEDAVYVPKRFFERSYAANLATFNETVKYHFDRYRKFLVKLIEHADKVVPQDAKNRAGAVRGRAFDSARYFLPAGTQTNLGMRINALDAARMIARLRAHSWNQELQDIGERMYNEAKKVLPTLLKHVEEETFYTHSRNLANSVVRDAPELQSLTINNAQLPGVQMLSWDRLALENSLAAFLYRPPLSFDAAKKMVLGWSLDQRLALFDEWLKGRGKFDALPEEFAMSNGWAFDVQMDYGAFRDLQRHRRLFQRPQPLTTMYGYVIPDDVIEVGLGEEFAEHMETTQQIIINLNKDGVDPSESEYLIPLAFLHRTIYNMDLRELGYIIELRSKPQGHVSYRRIVNQMWAEMARVVPVVAKYINNVPVEGIGVHS